LLRCRNFESRRYTQTKRPNNYDVVVIGAGKINTTLMLMYL